MSVVMPPRLGRVKLDDDVACGGRELDLLREGGSACERSERDEEGGES